MSKKKDDYGDSLKDPRWQKKRLEILNRDDWTCQICGAKDKMLHVHHISYFRGRKPWEYDNDLLITLCEDCHADDKKNLDSIKFYLDSLRKHGITNYELSQLLEIVDINIQGMHNENFILKMVGGIGGTYSDEDVDGDPYNWPFPCLRRLAERRSQIKQEMKLHG